jgi:hypothetical protein
MTEILMILSLGLLAIGMVALGKNIAGTIHPVPALANSTATAAGTGDATEVNGITIDLQSYVQRYQSIEFLIACQATLAADKTLTVVGNLQDSADGSSWSDTLASATLLTLTGGSGGSTERGVARMGYDLTKCRRYVRCQVTPDLSATGTDTSVMQGLAVLAGADEIPPGES